MLFEQPLASTSQITNSPSKRDGVPPQLEEDLHSFGALCIQQAGHLLELPQVVIATGSVLYHRFWFVTSLKQFGILDIALSSLFLAAKLEEHILRLRDLINVFHFLRKRVDYEKGALAVDKAKAKAHGLKPQQPLQSGSESNGARNMHYVPMDYFDKLFYDMKEETVIGEMQLLKRLGFNLIIKHPYGSLVNYLQVLDLASHSFVPQRAWGFLNDFFLTTLPATEPPQVLACAAIYLACLETLQPADQDTPLPPRPSSQEEIRPVVLPVQPRPWWQLFGVRSQAQLSNIVSTLLRFYERWSGQASSTNVWTRAAALNLPLTKTALREQLIEESSGTR